MAPIPEDDGGIPTPDWAAHGAELELDPTNFRNYGRNIAQVGKDLSTDSMSANSALQGPGPKDMLLSTSFQPGQDVQAAATRNAQEVGLFVTDLTKNVTAIASVALLMGEVFENMDAGNAAMVDAVEWAFLMKGGKKPAGLPSWVDPKKTVADTFAAPVGSGMTNTTGDHLINTIVVGNMTITTYRTADGGTRTIQSNGVITTEYLDGKDGKRRYEIRTTKEEGRDETVTINYLNGEPIGQTRRLTTTKKLDRNTTDQVTTIQQLDKDGKPRTSAAAKQEDPGTQHVVTHTYADGTHSREYYTEKKVTDTDDVNHNGNHTEKVPVRTDERTIGVQADPPFTVDGRTMNERLEEARRAGGL
ncbi:hypothetical protein [Amycolatopsis thermophila]|uniref:YD repeat-containing protein n=1 Tax=Amycolatopsis thermophila TaxID=206084 RepID=A0ABU0EMA1_9PSEU|nr:hypothetical protein [Amycolatopsis thermophila]MDQ0376150.1 hypothetical protein [Amycolatopsis thermophila]